MVKFEVGKKYECCDCDIPPIEIIKRTDKTCVVRGADGVEWRMKIRQRGESEIMIDSSVPEKWRELFTYYAEFQEEGEE